MRIRIRIKVMGIYDHWSTDPTGLHFEPLGLYCELPRLYFEPKKLQNFDFNADPDPASNSNADPCGSETATLPVVLALYPD
jgi:hypothetical protein